MPGTPRLAGRRLLAVARALRSPVAGKTIARLVIHQMGLTRLRAHEVADADIRPVVGFRVEPAVPPVEGTE